MFYPIIMIIKKKLSFINIKTIKLSIKNEIEIEIGTWDLKFLFEIDFSRSQEEFIPASQTSIYTRFSLHFPKFSKITHTNMDSNLLSAKMSECMYMNNYQKNMKF
jgi:hypothetical protein